MMSPKARGYKRCRDLGWVFDDGERKVPGTRVTRDLFGFIDIIALDGGNTVGIQVTSGPNHAARIKKITESEEAREFAISEARRIEVWSWALRGKRGERKRYQFRGTHLYINHYDEWVAEEFRDDL